MRDDDDRDRDPRRPRRPADRSGRDSRRRRESRGGDARYEPDWDEEEEPEEEEFGDEEREPRSYRPQPRSKSRVRSRSRPVRGPSFWERLGFGGAAPRRRDRGMDWGDVEEDETPYDEEEDTREEAQPEDGERSHEGERRRPRRPRETERRKLTLMEICMPVYGYAAMLPRDPSGTHPDYDAFRKEILAAIQRIEGEAPEHGIEVEDAREASYALCLFLDEQVVDSEWQGKGRWASEPLHIVLHRDAEGGENFFRRMEELSNRQRAVREVFLVSLALGYRGKYADLDPAQQASRIGEIRQKILRTIHLTPLEKQTVLFPEAYRAATTVVDVAPPAPRWWLMASGATVASVLLLWLILFWVAGWLPRDASEKLRQVRPQPATTGSAPTAAVPSAAPPAVTSP